MKALSDSVENEVVDALSESALGRSKVSTAITKGKHGEFLTLHLKVRPSCLLKVTVCNF